MLFSRKTKGYFVEMNENSVLLARTTSDSAPLEVEDLKEVALGDTAGIAEVLRQLQPRKPPSGYVHAVVGVYPPKRIVRRHTLELKKMKDQGYMSEVFTQQLRIEQDKFTVAMINAGDGGDYDLTKANQKEVLFCGAPNEDITAVQGEVTAVDNIGKKDFVRVTDKKITAATYVHVNFTAPAEAPAALKERLHLNDSVYRTFIQSA